MQYQPPFNMALTYQLQDRIASGRFAIVFKGVHVKKGTVHAVKQLPIKRHDVENTKNTRMLQSEINNWGKVTGKSEFILPLTDVVYEEHDGNYSCMLVSPLCTGGTLRSAAEKLPINEKIKIARQLAMAIEACHGEGILHSDIKPDNVLLDDNGKSYLCDFGASTQCTSYIEGGYVQWMTLNYAPPEALVPPVSIGLAADMWAYGVTIYELMHDMLASPHGALKQHGDVRIHNFNPLIKKHIHWPTHTRHTIADTATHKLCDIIIGCLEQNPKHRLIPKDVLHALQQ